MNRAIYIRRITYISVVFAMAGMLISGCGVPRTKGFTETAMGEIEALEYENALNTLVSAEEEGENPALIARARGIAHLGLAQYDEAVNDFMTVLSYRGSVASKM